MWSIVIICCIVCGVFVGFAIGAWDYASYGSVLEKIVVTTLVFGILSGVVGLTLGICLLTEWRDCSARCFGPVEVRAYTPWDNEGGKWHDMKTATNRTIQSCDYSVAVSEDIETWMNGISNAKVVHVPVYNKEHEFSAINDRSDLEERSIEILMTIPDKEGAQARALRWGVKKGELWRQLLKCGGYMYYVVLEE